MQDSPGSSLPPEHPESQDIPVPALLGFNTSNHELEVPSGQRENSRSCGVRCIKTSSKNNRKHPPENQQGTSGTSLTWGGSLVDDFIPILLRDYGVTDSQQGKELLDTRGCGLKAEEPVNQSPDLSLTVDSSHSQL